ncbi:PLP-dependent aminotransferase family protein [Actinophytocola oryzae]|uniref:aminotransferase-like domain-containing protein n=1 Tax=Actinophytocola oryzae TaxID=502181 RepID=UPI001FB99732|nr:PLP-dependent aminotransferase family protein [Actinophytocola oryzae]
MISFAGGLPAPELFDVDGWADAFAKAATDRRNLQYGTTEGDPHLRAQLAARMTSKGVPTTESDLLVTTGSQQALTLATIALVEPGDVVAVEEPTYLAALQCFQLAGARVVPVASDDQGMVPSALAEVLTREKPTLVYVVPTFANPSGRTQPAARREEIAALAATHDTWLVEDDPYGELRYRGTPVPPLAAYGDKVLYLGSLSKIGAPGLRLGWLRAPKDLMPATVIAKQAADLHTSTIDQAAAATYLANTDLNAHVAALCTAYRERRDTMIKALPTTVPKGTEWTDPDGGMFVWLKLPDTTDTADLLKEALKHNVAFVPGAPFFATTPDNTTFRMSFTTNPPEEISEGMHRLATTFSSLT